MIEELSQNGFVFFKGNLSNELLEYLHDKHNYIEGNSEESALLGIKFSEIEDISAKTKEMIIACLPENIASYMRKHFVFWSIKRMGKGYQRGPHNDIAIAGADYGPGPAIFLMWICPDEFEGREFVYGRVSNIPAVYQGTEYNGEHYDIKWNDPNLEVLGEIKPKTGTGVLIGRFDPQYWHGVKELTSNSEIITILGYIAEPKGEGEGYVV